MKTPILALALAALALPAAAEEMMFMADLQPVEGADSQGMGLVAVTVDTEAMTLSWSMAAHGLTGEPVAAHFHGPAAPGEDAPPVVDMTADAEEPAEAEAVPADILEGSATLTAEQLAQLQDGMMYVNVHTPDYPNGEIRGQVVEGEADAAAMDAMKAMTE